MMALKLWSAFSLYGTDGMGVLIDEAFSKAKTFARKIQKQADFELLMAPETNIVCFRYLPNKVILEDVNQYQSNIRQHDNESGAFHITQVDLDGVTWLRTTLMNPFTTEQDLDELLAALTLSAHALGSKDK